MKAALCVVVLLGALGICCFQQAAAGPEGTVNMKCCENFKTSRIPHSRLKSYNEVLLCPIPAVIFTNRRNMKICTKAGEKWVKNAVKYLDRKDLRARDRELQTSTADQEPSVNVGSITNGKSGSRLERTTD